MNDEKIPKYILLIAGEGYYPQSGARDWKKTFETREEAEACYARRPDVDGWLDGYDVTLNEQTTKYDWVYVIDLRDWIYYND